MKVTLREIRRLQEDVADKMKFLKENPDADYAELSELRSLTFSISMIFLRYSMEKDSTEVELGPEDGKVTAALKPFRKEAIERSATPGDFMEHLFTLTQGISSDIADLKVRLSACDSPTLRGNIADKLETAARALRDILLLRDDPKLLAVWRNVKIVERGQAAMLLGSARSEKKAAAARENGKKGGRPRKNAGNSPNSAKNTKKSAK